jgi:menaquinone-dependent protoporphyrinogen oxidase
VKLGGETRTRARNSTGQLRVTPSSNEHEILESAIGARIMTDPSRTKLLVAYASCSGSTREIADGIARVLRARHIQVDVKPVGEIQTVCGYGAFIIGSGVYNGAWTSEAMAFVREHRYVLAHGAVWLFSVGAFGDSQPFIGRFIRKEPREIDELTEALRPRSYRVFAGVIDAQRWSRAGRLVLHAFGGRVGDNRNWAEIAAWADSIAGDIAPTHASAFSPRKPLGTGTRSRRLRLHSAAATDVENASPLPGDRMIDQSLVTLTHAITIDAEPSAVWPWLVHRATFPCCRSTRRHR